MKTILVADHDPRIQQLIRKFLEPEGYEVLTVGDGIEALEKFRQNRINLLITYVMMPEMGGFELINAIQTDRFLFPEPRILILTAEPNTREMPVNEGVVTEGEIPFLIKHGSGIGNPRLLRKVVCELLAGAPVTTFQFTPDRYA